MKNGVLLMDKNYFLGVKNATGYHLVTVVPPSIDEGNQLPNQIVQHRTL